MVILAVEDLTSARFLPPLFVLENKADIFSSRKVVF